MDAPKGFGGISKTALTYGRIFLTLATGLTGVFSRKAGGFQENQVVAGVLWKLGLPWHAFGILDVAALLAGVVEVGVGGAVMAIPHMVTAGGEGAHEAAKWVAYPAGAFFIGRGGELLLASLMVTDQSGQTIANAVESRVKTTTHLTQ